MSEDHDAVVYDLDGTLVRLDVDWAEARTDVAVALREAGLDPGAEDVWELMRLAYEAGEEDVAEDALSEHEIDGARGSRRLPLAGEVKRRDGPFGICSLNCEEACRVALDRNGLEEHVDVVVGRDSTEGQKPDPGPLLEAIDRLGVEPEAALFVGDSESDEETAEAAGVDFLYMRERMDRT